MVKSLFTPAMAWLVSAAVASPFDLQPRQNGQCSKLHVMAAGGCKLPCTSDSLSFLGSTVAGITNEISDSDLWLVPYDGSPKQAAVSGPLLNQAIAQYTQDCPDTPIVLVGYSLGGIIITNSLCGQVPYTPNIIASVTYGEETFAYPTSYDRGTCRANAPLYARNNTAACGTWAPVMRSYCDALDPNCCSTGDIADNSAHFQYAGKYDTEVAAYVLSQYTAFVTDRGLVTSTSASATPSSAAISSTSKAAAASSPVFSSLPYYANSSIAVNTMTTANGNSAVKSAVTSITPTGNGVANSVVTETIVTSVPVNTVTAQNGNSVVNSPATRIITRTTTVAGETSIIPIYTATGLTTPTNPTETAVPNSAVAEPGNAPSGGAQIVSVGSGSGFAVAPSDAPATAVGPSSPASSSGMIPTGSLTPFNPNGASSKAVSGSLIGCALVAMGLLF